MKNLKSNTDKILKHVKNSLFEVCLKETNILDVEVTHTREYEYNKGEVEYIIENVAYIAENKRRLLLINAGPLSTVTYEALKFMAHTNAMAYAYAQAYVIHTPIQKLIANFYMRLFKPAVPVRFFENKTEAEVWLLKNFNTSF